MEVVHCLLSRGNSPDPKPNSLENEPPSVELLCPHARAS